MKLYCDEMLIKLGRWFRAAGYDTRIAQSGMKDREILQQTCSENRRLITRDRKLMEFRNADDWVVLLQCRLMEQCIEEVTHQLKINWLFRPFSRCLKCNTLLIDASTEDYKNLPDSIRLTVDRLCYCPRCQQLFWEGGHVQRMRTQLNRFTRYLETG